MKNEVDIIEDDIVAIGGMELLEALLKDNTTGRNIFWATDDYAPLGTGYTFHDQIQPELITGEHSAVIKPRVLKAREQQTARSKDMAEVFTPSWICNAQNNLIDNAWFGREGVFNTENEDHTWTPSSNRITFPEGTTWKDYVSDTRLEITCGEAPYLVSRYDTTTGEPIDIDHRIGLLDRKMMVVCENTTSEYDFIPAMFTALKSTYGYEWQGDNLLLARESVFFSVLDYYKNKFHQLPAHGTMKQIAEIIAWNLWQMDGLKFEIPGSSEKAKHEEKTVIQGDLFGSEYDTKIENKSCKGILCKIMDWEKNKPIDFKTLVKE